MITWRDSIFLFFFLFPKFSEYHWFCCIKLFCPNHTIMNIWDCTLNLELPLWTSYYIHHDLNTCMGTNNAHNLAHCKSHIRPKSISTQLPCPCWPFGICWRIAAVYQAFSPLLVVIVKNPHEKHHPSLSQTASQFREHINGNSDEDKDEDEDQKVDVNQDDNDDDGRMRQTPRAWQTQCQSFLYKLFHSAFQITFILFFVLQHWQWWLPGCFWQQKWNRQRQTH